TVYRGRGMPWKSVFAPWVQGYTPQFGFRYDPAAAKKGLEPVAGKSLTFSYSDVSTAAQQILILLQTSLKKAGVDITLEKVPRGAYEEGLNTRKIQNFADTLHTPLFPTPQYYLYVYYAKPPGGFLNWEGYANPEIEDISRRRGKPSTPVSKQLALARRGQQIAMRDLPIMPIGFSGEYRAVAKGLEITKSHTGNGLVFWQDLRWT